MFKCIILLIYDFQLQSIIYTIKNSLAIKLIICEIPNFVNLYTLHKIKIIIKTIIKYKFNNKLYLK